MDWLSLIFLCEDSQPDTNIYGPSPKYNNNSINQVNPINAYVPPQGNVIVPPQVNVVYPNQGNVVYLPQGNNIVYNTQGNVVYPN